MLLLISDLEMSFGQTLRKLMSERCQLRDAI